MNAPPILQRHPALRWLLPIGVAAVGVFVATGALGSSAPKHDALPRINPSALIAAVQKADTNGFSGTVVSHLSLGLPELPTTVNDASFLSLLAGSHTLQVWYGGADRQRIALQGPTDEADIFHDGRDVWQWSSAGRSAAHFRLPAQVPGSNEPSASVESSGSAAPGLLPNGLARQLLHAMDPSTKVKVDGSDNVADRAAYDLVLTPRDGDDTKVGRVRIAVDGETKIPLAVEVYARGESSPSIDVAFTTIDFGHQADRIFHFEPPSDASVKQLHPFGHRRGTAAGLDSPGTLQVTGQSWASVIVATPSRSVWKSLQVLRHQMTPVSGSFGSGRLLNSDLVSVLMTTDGRMFIGAVPPQTLYAAAGRK